ncbi:MAG TPA: lipoprotein [Rhodanobacteraceae bacterium]|nr:lipoprotein [Rhodanobacteraceae bacterium]
MRRLLIALVIALLLSGCATNRIQKQLTQTLDGYGATLRWGDFESALQYLDPEVLKKEPPSALQLARYKQVRVSQYEDSGPQAVSDTEVRQRVVIGLINLHTQRERSIIDNQVWKYDATAERWWLESGLPKIVE